MIGEGALRGYRNECGGCCCKIEEVFYGYARDNDEWSTRLSYNDIARITGWINLLKIIRLKITPDTVLAYLIATGQNALVDHVVSSVKKGFPFEKECECVPCVAFSSSIDNRLSNNQMLPSSYLGASSRDSSSTAIPKELIKMTERYARYRLREFIDVVFGVVSSSISGYSIDDTLPVGVKIPSSVINALQGFNPVTLDFNSIRTLHATIMPKTVVDDSCICSCVDDWIRKYPSLKWDPTTAIVNNSKIHEGMSYDVITPSVSTSYRKVYRLVSQAASELRDFLNRYSEDTNLEYENALEALCLGCEIILYLSCLCRTPYGASALSIPSINRANKLMIKNKLTTDKARIAVDEDTGRPSHGLNPVKTTILDRVTKVATLSPLAALCVAESLLSERSFGRYQSSMLSEIFSATNREPYGEVVTFLINEAVYQKDVLNNLKYSLGRLRERVNKNA